MASSSKGTRLFRLLFVALLFGVLLGVGMAVVRSYFGADGDKLLEQAEASYAAGSKHLKAKNAKAALESFRDAESKAGQAIDAFVAERKKSSNQDPEIQQEIGIKAGKGFWIQARAVRDIMFAQALDKGKPLDETLDSSTGKTFRNFLLIDDAERRAFAVMSLFESAKLLESDMDVQRAALRVRLMQRPLNLGRIEPLASRILAIDETDQRARYLLAHYEFEQPRANGKPPRDEQKSAKRMVEARTHLDKLEGYNLWRTLALEAKVTYWFLMEAVRTQNGTKIKTELDKLESLLFDPTNGVRALAEKKEQLEGRLASADYQGAFDLHLIGLDLLALRIESNEDEYDRFRALVTSTLEFSKAMFDDHESKALRKAALETGIEAVEKVFGVLDKPREEPNWTKWSATLTGLKKRAEDAGLDFPELAKRIEAITTTPTE